MDARVEFIPARMIPDRPFSSSESLSLSPVSVCFIERSVSRTISPEGVSFTEGFLKNNFVPYLSSSFLIWALKHCWLMKAFFAALEKLSSSANSRKSSSLVFIDLSCGVKNVYYQVTYMSFSHERCVKDSI